MASTTPRRDGDTGAALDAAAPQRELQFGTQATAAAAVPPLHHMGTLPAPAPLPLAAGMLAGAQHGALGDAAQQVVVAAVLRAALSGDGANALAPPGQHALAVSSEAAGGESPHAEASPPQGVSAGSCGGGVSRDSSAAAMTAATASEPTLGGRGGGRRGRGAGRRAGVRSAPGSLRGARGDGDAQPRPAGDGSPPPRRTRRRASTTARV